MPDVAEKIFSVPKKKVPVLVCGLPGSGYVGKLAADHLVGEYGMKIAAEYTTGSFPPQAEVGEDGTVRAPKGELFYAPRGKGLLLFTADAQPNSSEGEYELADAVVKFAKRYGVKRVYALAAYITGGFSQAPKVCGSGTSKGTLKDLEKAGATLMKEGGISGMNGVLIGMAGLRGLEGGCLLGETSGFVVDAGASKSVLEVLSKLAGLEVDTSKLKQRAEETKKVITQLQAMYEGSQEAQQPRREPRPGYIG